MIKELSSTIYMHSPIKKVKFYKLKTNILFGLYMLSALVVEMPFSVEFKFTLSFSKQLFKVGEQYLKFKSSYSLKSYYHSRINEISFYMFYVYFNKYSKINVKQIIASTNSMILKGLYM